MPNAPRPADGQPLTRGVPYRVLRTWLNWLLKETRANRIHFGEGITGQRLPSGTVISAQVGRSIRTVMTPSGGIDAMAAGVPGTATCLAYEWDGTNKTVGTEDVEVLNDFPGDVEGEVLIKIHWESGAWWVLVEACPA